jgi:hypothetical protein
MLPGLAKHYDRIYYSAYNEKPTDNNNAAHVEMTAKPVELNLPVLPN